MSCFNLMFFSVFFKRILMKLRYHMLCLILMYFSELRRFLSVHLIVTLHFGFLCVSAYIRLHLRRLMSG